MREGAVRLRVQLWGPFADAVGCRMIDVDLASGASAEVATVLERIADSYPQLQKMLAGARLAVNCQFAAAEQRVGEADELALIGMVSGG